MSGAFRALVASATRVLRAGKAELPTLDLSGNMLVSAGARAAGENLVADKAIVEGEWSYFQNTGTTAGIVIHTGPGKLHMVVIGTPVANGVVTLFDNTAGSGAKIFEKTLPGTLLNDSPPPIEFDVTFALGLTLVVATGACAVSIAYRGGQ